MDLFMPVKGEGDTEKKQTDRNDAPRLGCVLGVCKHVCVCVCVCDAQVMARLGRRRGDCRTTLIRPKPNPNEESKSKPKMGEIHLS